MGKALSLIPQKFTVSFSGEIEMTVEELWPDGDAPTNPTIDDVVALIQAYPYSTSSLLNDWNLEEDLEVSVSDGRTTAPAIHRVFGAQFYAGGSK